MVDYFVVECQGWEQVGLMCSLVYGSMLIVASTTLRCIQTLRGAPPPSAESPSLTDGHAAPQPAAPFRCC